MAAMAVPETSVLNVVVQLKREVLQSFSSFRSDSTEESFVFYIFGRSSHSFSKA